MDARKKLHRGLRADGLLLDVHPEPVATSFAVCNDTTYHPLDQLVDTSNCIANIHGSRDEMATLVTDDYFTIATATTFDFGGHFDSIADWRVYRAERGSTSRVDEAAVAKADQLLKKGGDLRVVDRVSARLFHRL